MNEIHNHGMSLILVFALGFALIATAGQADQRDPTLDRLFDQLLEAADAEEADPIESRIWGLWIRHEKDDINGLMRKGVLTMSWGRHEAALKYFDKIVELAPDFAEGWNKRATLHYLMRNYDASVRDVQKTLELEPRHFGALSGLGLINMALGYDDAALAAFRKALEVNPHMPGVRANIESLLGKRI